MSRKPTARTIERRLWTEMQCEYITYREYCIYSQYARPLLAHGKKLGAELARIRDDPDIVNDETFLYRATQLIAEGERKTERALWQTSRRMIKEGYDIQGGE